jgi:trigger factor
VRQASVSDTSGTKLDLDELFGETKSDEDSTQQ